MLEQPKRGGPRPGSGRPRKPREQSASVRIGLALTPAEAEEYRRRGATKWVRRELEKSEPKWPPSTASATKRPTMGELNKGIEMSNTSIVQAIETAIAATATSGPGTWSVNSGDGCVMLVWTTDDAKRSEMYGDYPWSEWGGNAIIEASGLRPFDDSGIDGCTDRYGNLVLSQWVQWNVE